MDKRSYELRLKIVKILEKSRRGHVGSALSILDIVRVLYDNILRFDPSEPNLRERDRFILSKGHGCLAIYLLLADKGFFPEDELYTFCEFESRLGGHPEYGLPGVEAATGALGHGLSIGVGMALAANIDKKDYRVFVLVGDGECQEGSVWEAALSAGKHRLSNLIVIVDCNKMQCYGPTDEVQTMEPFGDKWKSFGFEVHNCKGHDIEALRFELSSLPYHNSKPSVLICNTTKGQGLTTAENNPAWHHKSKLNDDDIKQLYKELELIK